MSARPSPAARMATLTRPRTARRRRRRIALGPVRGRGRRRRADRRRRERGGPGRHRLRERNDDGLAQGDDHRQPRVRSRDALHADQPRDPVQRGGQPEHEEPADRRVDRETDWFRVSVWGDRAERMAESLRKGNKVFVEGRFKTREFEGRDGQKRIARDHRRFDREPREARPGRRGLLRRALRRWPGRWSSAGGGEGGEGGQRRPDGPPGGNVRPTRPPTMPTSTTFRSDDRLTRRT